MEEDRVIERQPRNLWHVADEVALDAVCTAFKKHPRLKDVTVNFAGGASSQKQALFKLKFLVMNKEPIVNVHPDIIDELCKQSSSTPAMAAAIRDRAITEISRLRILVEKLQNNQSRKET